MTEATAGRVVDLLEASAEGREHYAGAADVADELGIRGILTRMVGSRMPPAAEGERVYALLWDETLLEARADVGRLLGRLDIPYLVYKGGALLGEQYRTGDVRMVDLDVLVPLVACERAAAAFEAEGWRKKDPVGGPALPGAPGAVFARPFGDGAISALDVDVHWRVAPVDRLFPWRGEGLPEEVWRSAMRAGSAPGTACRAPRGPARAPPGATRSASTSGACSIWSSCGRRCSLPRRVGRSPRSRPASEWLAQPDGCVGHSKSTSDSIHLARKGRGLLPRALRAASAPCYRL